MTRSALATTLLLCACPLLACGGARVPAAVVGPQTRPMASVAQPAAPFVPPPTAGLDAGHADDVALRWVITPANTRVELRARSAFLEPTFTFTRFRARVSGVGTASASFRAVLATASLEGGGGLAPFVRDQLLEASVYPRITFDGAARCSAGTDACVIDGVLDLHGVQRPVRFEGTLQEEPDVLHLVAVFELPRKLFNLRLPGAWDAFVADEVRVRIDARARRERVTVETGDP